MRVMVVGGKGFIGSYTVKALKSQGYEVYTYDRIDGQEILNNTMLKSAVDMFEPDWVIHLAGQVSLAPSLKDPQNDANINIIGTLNVLEAVRKLNKKGHPCGLTFSSSGAVYGNNYQYPEPVSPYGISKLTAETYCRLYNSLYNMHTVVFRFSSVYGYGRAPTSINLIVQKAMRGETIRITGDGRQTRDFTYVTDIARGLVKSAEGKFPSGVYDIGTGTATSLNELVALIGRLLRKDVETEYIPESVGDPKRNELNVSKLANYGFKARVSLEEGVRTLIKTVKAETTKTYFEV